VAHIGGGFADWQANNSPIETLAERAAKRDQ
jgi:hypothetical protein